MVNDAPGADPETSTARRAAASSALVGGGLVVVHVLAAAKFVVLGGLFGGVLAALTMGAFAVAGLCLMWIRHRSRAGRDRSKAGG